MAEMPFADTGCGVTCGLKRLGQRDFVVLNATGGARTEHACKSGSYRQPAGQQRRAAWRTNRSRGVELGEPHPFPRHAVEIRRADDRMSVAAQIAPAQIVREDDDDIRPRGLGARVPLQPESAPGERASE